MAHNENERVEFASEQADRRLGRLAFQVSQTLKSRDAEAVHDLRVAVRRFSQAIRVFKAHFRGKEVRKIRRHLKQMMDLAGEVRNCDIALKLVSKSRREIPAGLHTELERQRREEERALVAFLKHWVDRKSSLKWRAIVAGAASANGSSVKGPSVAVTARRVLPCLAREFFERGDEAAKTNASARDLHEFRITSKKFRYTLEVFASLYGRQMNSSLETIKRAQTLLGDINDCDTVRRMLSKYEDADRLTSWLKRRQRRRIEEFQRYWAETLAGGAELRAWTAFLSHPGGVGRLQARRKPAGRAAPAAIRSHTAVA